MLINHNNRVFHALLYNNLLYLKYDNRNLQYIFPQIATIRVEKKADSLFKIVSAASVVAKVTRDTHLQSFEFIEQRFLALAEHFSGSSTKEGLPATKKIEEKDTMEVDDTTAGLSSPAEKRRKLDLSEELKSDKEENHLDDESIVGAKKDKVGIEIVTRSFGSGYPGDKETVIFFTIIFILSSLFLVNCIYDIVKKLSVHNIRLFSKI